MITLEQAKSLKYGDMLYHTSNTNADGSPQRWRVNGKPKTWKRNPEKVQVPLKYGLWSYAYLTERDLDLVSLNEDEVEEDRDEWATDRHPVNNF